MWVVYILLCIDSSYYVGVTTDLSQRLHDHQNKKGATYTRTRLPVKLMYQEIFKTKQSALKKELQIKGWSKKKKIALINSDKVNLIKLSKSRD